MTSPRPRRFDAVLATLLLGLGALVPAGAAKAQADGGARVEAEVRLDPDDVLGRDEIATLTIAISTRGAQVPAIPDPVFELENLRIVGGPSQSTGLTIVNGQPSASRSLSWQLLPRKLGKARVHSVKIVIEGQEIRLADRVIEVVENPPPRRRRTATDPFDRLFNDPFFDSPTRRRRPSRQVEAPKIFLKAEVTPANPWVGQQAIYTLNLYTQVDINPVNPEDFPDFKGFWVQVIPQPEQLRPEMVEVDGEVFGRVVLLERALFPRRAGTFEVEPIRARMVARIPDEGPFGALMPRSREILRTSNPVTIEVRDLPSPPAGFQGAVGDLELEASLSPAELAVGEAATLILNLVGQGHLQGVPAPEIPELPGIQVFPPQQQSDEELRGKTVRGRRTWSYVLVPQRSGEWEVPPIAIPYFDPRGATYHTATTPALSLRVRGTTSVAAAGGESVELHPIRTAALPAVAGGPRLAAVVPWLFVLPWAAAGVLLLARRRGGDGGERTAHRHLLRRLEAAAAEERPRQAAAEMEDAWRELLQERFGIPPGAPSTQWGPQLRARGVAPERAEALVKLADDLHYLRYAPKLSSVDELKADLLERSRKLAREVA